MTFLNQWILTILLLVPLIGGFAALFARSAKAVRRIALGTTLITLFAALLVLMLFHRQSAPYEYAPGGIVQMVCHIEILPAIHWNYRIAVDGLSLSFLLVTSLMGVLAAAQRWRDNDRPASYFACLLWLEACTLGVFLSFDLLLMWAFLTISLVPCCALIHLDGNQHAGRVAMNFLTHMLIGTACMFVATLGLRLMSTHCLAGGTLDLVRLASLRCAQRPLFLLMLIGFLVRLPVIPLHSWLTATVRSSSPATVTMLAGLIPLMGGYGLLRVVIPLFPTVMASLGWLCGGLGVLMTLYSALYAIGSDDGRSAIVHFWLAMSGFALIGIATSTIVGLNASVLILLSQALVAAALIGPMSRDRSISPAIAWGAELVIPGLLGQAMVLLGLFQSAAKGSALPSAQTNLAILVGACFGVLLIGTAGVRILGLVRGASDFAAPAERRPAIASVGLAAVLLAIFLVPFCLAYTRGGRAGMLPGAH